MGGCDTAAVRVAGRSALCQARIERRYGLRIGTGRCAGRVAGCLGPAGIRGLAMDRPAGITGLLKQRRGGTSSSRGSASWCFRRLQNIVCRWSGSRLVQQPWSFGRFQNALPKRSSLTTVQQPWSFGQFQNQPARNAVASWGAVSQGAVKNTRSSCFWERIPRYFGGLLSTGVSSRPDGGTRAIIAYWIAMGVVECW